MKQIATIETENEEIRFAVFERDDGLYCIDEERYKAGDEYTGPYWSPNQVGLFGSLKDVKAFLSSAAPKPVSDLPSDR